MNVDLQWCPCGKQARENDMYCSDICHFLEQYPSLNRVNCDEIYNNDPSPSEYEQKYEEQPKQVQTRLSKISSRRNIVTPFGACRSIPQRLSYRTRQRINNQYSTFRAINALSSVDYFSQKAKSRINLKGKSKLAQGLKKNTVSHSNYNTRMVNSSVEKSRDQPLIVY